MCSIRSYHIEIINVTNPTKTKFFFFPFYVHFCIDGTRPQRVVVPLDLDSAGFTRVLREQIPDLPEAFELCKVNGQRWVAPLTETTPGGIHGTNALGCSACTFIQKVQTF